jgi:DNA-binding NarL/FixJ family response regulator
LLFHICRIFYPYPADGSYFDRLSLSGMRIGAVSEGMSTFSIVILDEHGLFRQGLNSFFSSRTDLVVLAETGNDEEALSWVKRTKPNVILFDSEPQTLTRLHLLKAIHRVSPKTRTIMLYTVNHPTSVAKLLREGLNGCISKNASLQELVDAITDVMRGQVYLCPSTRSTLDQFNSTYNSEDFDINVLTSREMQVAKLMAEGKTSKEISDDLNISLKTVEVHRYRILSKLQLKNTTSLINLMTKPFIL